MKNTKMGKNQNKIRNARRLTNGKQRAPSVLNVNVKYNGKQIQS